MVTSGSWLVQGHVLGWVSVWVKVRVKDRVRVKERFAVRVWVWVKDPTGQCVSQRWSLSDGGGGYDETHQPLLLLIRDWVKSGPACLIRCCCVEPKLSGVFPKALLGYFHHHV